jgi:dihydroneopterin triphosphate diphosphatase
MPRAPLQVLVLPFRVADSGRLEYAVFRRAGDGGECWQGIAGGAEVGETAEEAARREMTEEAGIPPNAPLLPLDTQASVPAHVFRDRHLWGPGTYVVPQRAFGVRLSGHEIVLSDEHAEYRWVGYDDAADLLGWDSNKTALWELNERLRESHR